MFEESYRFHKYTYRSATNEDFITKVFSLAKLSNIARQEDDNDDDGDDNG